MDTLTELRKLRNEIQRARLAAHKIVRRTRGPETIKDSDVLALFYEAALNSEDYVDKLGELLKVTQKLIFRSKYK